MLFIHGLGSSSAVWKNQLEVLKKRYQLITKQLINRVILIDVPTKQTGMSLFNSLFLKMLERDLPRVVKDHYKKMTRDERLGGNNNELF